MVQLSRFPIGGFALVVLLAGANVAHAAYFDWSDLGVRGVFAAVCVLTAIRWKRLAAGIAACFALVVALFWTVHEHPAWTQQVRPGDRVTHVEEVLGQPTHEFINLDEARRQPNGYALPSPIRFRHSGPVMVYVGGEHALWIFRDTDVVQATFVGGS